MTSDELQTAVRQIRTERGLGLKAAHDFLLWHGSRWREVADAKFGPLVPSAQPKNAADALAAVRTAVQGYYAALDRREHGGVAQNRAFEQIQSALDMHWVQGATLTGEPK